MTANPLPTRTLGRGDHALTVSALGLGCMTMAGNYGAGDDAEAVATLDTAIELGVTFFDTADVYGDNDNERFVGTALRSRRDDVVIATKFGIGQDDLGTATVNGRARLRSPAPATRHSPGSASTRSTSTTSTAST